jgi:hypothetical protein
VHWVAERKEDSDAHSKCVFCRENGSMGNWLGGATAERWRCGGTSSGTTMATSVGSSARKEQRLDPLEESSARRRISAHPDGRAVAYSGRLVSAAPCHQTTPVRPSAAAAARPSSASPPGEKPWSPVGVPTRLSGSVPRKRAPRASSAGGTRQQAAPLPRRAPRPTSLRW